MSATDYLRKLLKIAFSDRTDKFSQSIFDKETNETLGVALIYNIKDTEALFRILILDPEKIASGEYRELFVSAGILMIDIAFTQLQLGSLYVNIPSSAQEHVTLYQRMGFRSMSFETRLDKSPKPKVLSFELLKENWEKTSKK